MHSFRFGLVILAIGGSALGCGDSGADGAGGGGGKGPVNECPAVSGAGTEHASVVASETWTAEGSPHIVTADLTIPEGVVLTLEPCAEVRMQAGRLISVDGSLVGKGTATRNIRILAADGPWSYLEATDPGRISLSYATIEGGGVVNSTGFAMVEARGDQLAPAAPVLDFEHVTISGSTTFGVSLRGNAGFSSTSKDLTITGCSAPMRILPRLASNVPDGDYTGNTADEIVIETEVGGNIDVEDVTMHDRGVPYRVGGELTFGELVVGPSPVKLTLEPGVELRFRANGKLTADVNGAAGGAISAIGTADKPIVFTSASSAPVPGDWVGIWIEHLSPDTRFENVQIQYAGGPSGASDYHCEPDGTFSDEDALITFFEEPTSSVLTNSVLSNSPKRGVNLAYYGSAVDFLASNTYVNIAQCKVSTPRPPDGQCPTSSPCP